MGMGSGKVTVTHPVAQSKRVKGRRRTEEVSLDMLVGVD
tara:strand:- start:8863 stop:8979 length:117 start_codon:yes stop_codon:yes gene_type:complete